MHGAVGEELGGGEVGRTGGERAGGGGRRGQSCTVVGRIGELLGVGLGDPRVAHGSGHACGGHVGRQVETLGSHDHAALLLLLLLLLLLSLLVQLTLTQVITQHLSLPLGQHLSVDCPLEDRDSSACYLGKLDMGAPESMQELTGQT